jgi:hypothetical protein
MQVSESLSTIKECILKSLNTKGWKNDEFMWDFYPYDNKSTIMFRYVKFKFKKDVKFSCDLSVENFNFCILTVDESEQEIKSSDDDFVYFYFKIKPAKTITKCVERALQFFSELKCCESCLRIYHKLDLDKNDCCCACNMQSIFEKRDFCCICHDSENVKLTHRLPCLHEFHFSCLTKLKKRECPLCRACFSLRRK